MAITYPISPIFQTLGEERVFNFLKNQLSDAWHLFYEPIVDDARPDFVLFSPFVGILIIEVKDYVTQTIKRISPNHWELIVDGQLNSVLSPYEQARQYMYKLSERLQKQREYCTSSGIYKGKLMFPVMCAVWMTNIPAHDAEVIGISNVIPSKFLLIKDHFNEPNKIEEVLSGILTSKFVISEVPKNVAIHLTQQLHPILEVPEYEAIRQAWFDAFQSNIKVFPSLVDEVLFIATEIRHLLSKSTPASSIAVYVQNNRHLQSNTLLEKVKEILADMGVVGVMISELIHNEIPDGKTYIFIMDLQRADMDEKKEAMLSKLLSEASNHTWFSSSSL